MPRAVVAGAIGLGMGTAAALLRLSPISYSATAATASFWAATLMLMTFKRNVGRMLLWLLILDACLGFYQVSLYSDLGGEHVAIRIGPVLIGSLILGVTSLMRARPRSRLPIFWVAGNVPALIPLVATTMPLLDGLLYWTLAVLYPLSFYLALKVLAVQRQTSVDQIGNVIACGAFAICVVPLALLPLELAYRSGRDVSELQVGARSYAALGIVMLVSALLVERMRKTGLVMRTVTIGAVLALFALSFSRGALVGGTMLSAGILVLGRRARARFVIGLVAGGAVLIVIVSQVYPALLNSVGKFWVLRTNIGSYTTSDLDFSLARFLITSRDEIWDFGFATWRSSPLWGHGIGSTPYLFREASNGVFGYSGMHNLGLTVLAERGVAGLCATLMLIWRIAKLSRAHHGKSLSRSFTGLTFFVFLLFSLSTGVELFLNSTRAMNTSVTVFLFAYLGFLEANSAQTANVQIRRESQRIR